ncbi:Protein of unknown function [Gryllus bimaculatus]|nr:Protein of unknown function [Gryllus bimaculatus]
MLSSRGLRIPGIRFLITGAAPAPGADGGGAPRPVSSAPGGRPSTACKGAGDGPVAGPGGTLHWFACVGPDSELASSGNCPPPLPLPLVSQRQHALLCYPAAAAACYVAVWIVCIGMPLFS